MKVYIAGPMTNRPHFNCPAFFAAAERLIKAGDIPLNPQFFLMAFLLLITCLIAGKAATVQLGISLCLQVRPENHDAAQRHHSQQRG